MADAHGRAGSPGGSDMNVIIERNNTRRPGARRASAWSLTALGVALLPACGANRPLEGARPGAQPQTPLGAAIVDAKGNRWISNGPAPMAAEADLPSLPV